MQTAFLASTTLFIASAIHLLIGGTIYLKNANDRVNRTFFLLSFTLFLWALFYGITYLTNTPAQTLFWTRVLTIPTFFYPSLFLYLALIFPDKHYKMTPLFFVYHLLFVLLFISSAFSNNYIYFAQLIPAGIDFKFGAVYNILGLYIVSTMLYGCYILLKKLFALKDVKRSQILFVCIGAFLSIMMGAIFGVSLPILGVPQYNFFAPTGTIFVILLWGYAITKHELMDIQVVISRGLAYGIVSALLILSYVFLNLTPLPILSGIAANALLALFWAFSAHRLREFIQTPLEEKWITGWYNSDKLINSIAKKLVPVLEREEAFRVIAAELKAGIKIKQIDIINDRAELDALQVKEVTRSKDKILIPLASSAALEGTLSLGPKISEDPFNEKDLTLFRTVAIQAQTILDRIRPYEKIKREFEANQQKLFEAEKQLERAQRLSSLGRIVSEVAHEIRNPMAVIFSKAGRIKNNLNDPKYVLEAADLILDRCEHIEKVVGTMRALSLPPKYEPQELDVLEPIENSLRFMPVKSAIKIIKEYSPVPHVMGDKNELERVFINLFTNAYDAMAEKGGELYIRLKPEGQLVKIEVEDTGAGISAEDLPKIFDPFFTTKFGKTDDRMGFGLSIVHNIIVEKHKGTITAESTPGQGTKFSLTLPAKID